MSMALVTILTYGQQKGDKAVGGNILYGFDENNIGIAGKYQWNITDAFRLEPSASYYPQKSNIKMWDMNVNLHYLFKMNEKFNLYPLGGLTLFGVKPKNLDSESEFGVNLGGGAEYKLTENISVGAEMKYQILSDWGRAVLSIGMTYRF